MTLAEALRYQPELDAAQRPAYGNPNLAAQGRNANIAERSRAFPFMQAADAQFAKEKSSLSDPRAATDLINKGFLAGLGGAPVDLINMGLTPLGMGSAFPFGGSEHIKRAMEDYGVATPTERPIMEGIASLTPPRAVMGAARFAGQGAEAAGKALAPVAGQALENYMGRAGMRLNIVPVSKTGPLTDGEMRHLLAQQRAALPVEKGGLGLPAGNTSEQRAAAMGAEFGWGHGSNNPDITTFKPSKTGAQGPGIYATNYLPETNMYSSLKDTGNTSYPLAVFKDEALVSKLNNPYDELKVVADDELISELFKKNKSAIITNQEPTPDWLLKQGVSEYPERQHYVSVNPDNFRSRFAAFDPWRRNAAIAALMGVASPDLLAKEPINNSGQK